MGKFSKNDLQVLTIQECIRKRPGMYTGGVDSRGRCQVLYELLDNAADQALAGELSQIQIRIDGRMIHVVDDGPGLPFDQPGKVTANLGTDYLTQYQLPSKLDRDSPHLSFGGYGCGLVIVTSLSDQFTVRSVRDGLCWQQTFFRGIPIDAAMLVQSSQYSGSEFLFALDPEIFPDTTLDHDQLRARFRAISHLVPGLRIQFQEQEFLSQRGIVDWAFELATSAPPPTVWSTEVADDDCRISVATAGITNAEPKLLSFANGIETQSGNHHDTLLAMFKRLGWTPEVAIIAVAVNDPMFEGPTRSCLRTPEVVSSMEHLLFPLLDQHCRSARLGRHS